jgi:hypothetical protein
LDSERGAREGHHHDHRCEAGAAAAEPTGEQLPGAGAGERRGPGSGREDGDATRLEGENLERAVVFVIPLCREKNGISRAVSGEDWDRSGCVKERMGSLRLFQEKSGIS